MILLALTLALAGMAYMSNGRGGNHKQVITAAGLAAGDQGAGHSARPGETVPASPAASPDGCLSSVKAITYYRQAYTASRTAMNLAGAVPRVWYQQCRTVRKRAVEWRARARKAARELFKVTAKRNAIARRLNRGLADTPMHGLGRLLEEEGRAAGISPYFIAAAAGTESSFGAAACRSNPRNVWGLSSCGPGWHVPTFTTWRQAIRFYARFLAARWPNATTPYHYHGYAACSPCWGKKTAWWMTARFGVPAFTRYYA